MNLRGSVAIVTGASSGIGRATALELARRGAHMALAARRLPGLEEVAALCRAAGVRAIPIAADLDRDEDCRELVERATLELGQVDLLVNNAGFAIYDTIAEAKLEDHRSLMETNYFGAVRCTRAALPQMLQRGRGSIVFVSSITGIMGFASMGAYCASKFALNGFAEALRDEVIGKGIDVSMVCPATTRTGFFAKAERGKMPAANRLILAITPERVARAVARAAERGSYRIILPWTAAAFMKLKEMFPRTAHFLMREVSALLTRKSH
jgi:short-subunit dehydrogenase